MITKWVVEFWLVLWCGLLSSLTTTTSLDFPAVEVDVVLVLEFVASDIEADGDGLVGLELIEPCALVFDHLELEILRVVVITDGDHELTLGKPAGEGLGVENDFDFSGCFVHGGILGGVLCDGE